MSGKAPYTQAELQRAVKALKAVGEVILGVEHQPNGTFRVLTAQSGPSQPLSPLEAWERENGYCAAWRASSARSMICAGQPQPR